MPYIAFSSALNRSDIPKFQQVILANYRFGIPKGKTSFIFELGCPHCAVVHPHEDLIELKGAMMRHLVTEHYSIKFDYSSSLHSEHVAKYPLGTALDVAVWVYSRVAAIGEAHMKNTYGIFFWATSSFTLTVGAVNFKELGPDERFLRFTDLWRRNFLPKELGGAYELQHSLAACLLYEGVPPKLAPTLLGFMGNNMAILKQFMSRFPNAKVLAILQQNLLDLKKDESGTKTQTETPSPPGRPQVKNTTPKDSAKTHEDRIMDGIWYWHAVQVQFAALLEENKKKHLDPKVDEAVMKHLERLIEFEWNEAYMQNLTRVGKDIELPIDMYNEFISSRDATPMLLTKLLKEKVIFDLEDGIQQARGHLEGLMNQFPHLQARFSAEKNPYEGKRFELKKGEDAERPFAFYD